MEYQTRRNIKKTIEIGVKVEDFIIVEQIDFINCFKWLKKNMVFIY